MFNKFLKYLFYLTLFSIILGPVAALPLGILQVNIYFTDIVVGLISLIWIIRLKGTIKLIRSDKIASYFCIFVAVAIISLIFSPINLNINEKLISSLYIIRLFSYFFVYLTVRYLTDSSTIGGVHSDTPEVFLRLLTFAGVILAVIGWLGYFLYPDLRNLYYLGWDPHYKRIFSSFFDPNYF
ncbi:hypothetical protein HZB96_04020 [Candidatus Gottesmanbacteria bacterium]|nr:hypothetical protein [Candidatus Gottesmanbacteria bacterium]